MFLKSCLMYVRRWPWRIGTCDAIVNGLDLGNGRRIMVPNNENCGAGEDTWVLPCFQCCRAWCETHACVDSCADCGEPICNPCLYDHRKSCRRRLPNPSHGTTPRGRVHPWLQRLCADLRCPHCTSMRDIGTSHSCEQCEGAQCLNEHCRSQIRTSSCCGLDICGPCRGTNINMCVACAVFRHFGRFKVGEEP